MDGDFYSIKTEVFEGPLDVLLSLIEKRKLLINDISLSKVADDYISYIKSLGDFPVEEASQFILIASTLVLIKSKSLLPDLALSYEEEANISDLEDRLKLHKRFKDLSLNLKKMFGKNIMFERLPSKNKIAVFAPDKNTDKTFLYSVIKKVITSIPKAEEVPKAIVKKVISLQEAIVSLTDRIGKSLKLSFKEFSGLNKKDRVSVIVNFLAMLELVKQGIIQVRQDEIFHDIEMETNTVGTPRY
jgi:segregation and condensation protein A